MKQIFLVIFSLLALNSCNQPSETPPLDKGYSTTFIMPDPVDLTAADREEIKQMEAEYKEAISK